VTVCFVAAELVADCGRTYGLLTLKVFGHLPIKRFKGQLPDGPEDRLMQALRLCVLTIQMGNSVLVHCRQGRHRSAAFASFLLALLHLCSKPQEPQEPRAAELRWERGLHTAWESVPKKLMRACKSIRQCPRSHSSPGQPSPRSHSGPEVAH
jgi:hypothetical protein